MRKLTTKDADEDLALRFLSSVLHAPVVVHDKRSGHSTYDLEIHYTDGHRGAVEVVSSRDREQSALLSEVRRIGYTRDKQLTRMWHVRVRPGTMIRQIYPLIPAFLAQLELSGISDLDQNRFYGIETYQLTRRLHIRSCLSYSPTAKHPPGFYLLPDAWASWVGDGEDIPRFSEEFLADERQSDVLRKLEESGLDERHVVIVVTTGQLGPHTAVDMRLLPTSSPDVADCVDWLWVIASQAPPVRACYWTRPGGWATAVLSQ
jgi:hypothetical protein